MAFIVPPKKRPDAQTLIENPRCRAILGRLLLTPEEVKARGRGTQSTLASFFSGSGGGGASSQRETHWECGSCTLRNPQRAKVCEVCGAKMPAAAAVTGAERAAAVASSAVHGGAAALAGSKRLHADIAPPPAAGGSAPPRALTAPPLQTLPRGVVLLRGFLDIDAQHALLAAADSVSHSGAPFTIPKVKHPFTGKDAFGNIYMTYAGRVWDGTHGAYADVGAADAVVPNLATGCDVAVPPVPATVFELGRAAVAAALALDPGAFEEPEWDYPNRFTTLFNYYCAWSSISVHADHSEPSLKEDPRRTWPVVSLSVGDSAVFTIYPDSARNRGALDDGEGVDIVLRSGDVICFGGPARLLRHAVSRVVEVGGGGCVRPPGLRMVSGRLNVTLRQL